MTGWSSSAPLLGESIVVKVHAGLNFITLGGDGGAPDLDRVVVAPA